jgi:hypothetical protein
MEILSYKQQFTTVISYAEVIRRMATNYLRHKDLHEKKY